MLISEIKAGMVLAKDIVDAKGNLLLQQGIALTEYYITRLKQLGLSNIPIYDAYASELKKNTVVSPGLREELTHCFRSLFNIKSHDILNPRLRTMYLKQIQAVVGKAIDETGENLPQIINIQVRQPSEDEVGHAVNVCLLSVITGLYIKLPRPVLMDLALGALFHDLGKSIVPTIDGPGTDHSRLHTVYGQQLLLKNKISSIAARIAAEHHEHYDGQGYPSGLSGKKIHPLSRLVAIANYFDNAMTAASKTGAKRQNILDDMLAGGNTQFDMYLLRAFFQTTPLYPVGSLVKLNNNKIAYVIKNKTRFTTTPTVQIAGWKTGASGLAVTDDIIDLAFQPNITIVDVVAE
ncbi:hypothetical protein SCACP_37780 [Sporomusa carbonis]|uniref:HD-GYP domain-containing protein n=1 Tax=Sporomusa carbonis TaxID=3076075 RepID=UPI003A5D9A1F